MNGTFELWYSQGQTDSPYQNREILTFVINGENDTLCVDGKLLQNPFQRREDSPNPIFEDTDTGIFYEISYDTVVGAKGTFGEVNVEQGDINHWVGQFRGDRINTETVCGDSGSGGGNNDSSNAGNGSGLTLSQDAMDVFSIAEQLYPNIFSNGSELREYLGYIYRYFPVSGVYVGIKDGHVFLKGGMYGKDILDKGSITSVLGILDAVQLKRQQNQSGAVSGLYDLTISGHFSTSLADVDITNITINDVPAPQPTDTDTILNAVSSLGATSLAHVVVQTINNTDSRVTFNVEFDANLTGFGTVTYSLTYDYVK